MSSCIVVVDDEPSVLHVLQSVLEDSGFTTVGIRHPARVLDEASRCRPCLFLIDLTLPGRSGIELAGDLRSNGFGGTPMLAISASHIMTRAATHSGLFQAVLDKPLDLDMLLHCVTQALGTAASSSSLQTTL